MVESLAQTNKGNRRVANRFVGIRDFPCLTLGIRDSEAKIRARFGIEGISGGGMPKTNIGVTELPEILGGDYGIEESYWGPSYRALPVPKTLASK